MLLSNLGLAFDIAFQPANLLLCFFGVLLGTLTGVLPGLGASTAISLLLPITLALKLDPAASIIMLAGIYYGALYGGSTTSILVNVPGEGSSMVACLDGYPMARQGRAGAALAICAIGSFISGTFAVLMLMILGPHLVQVAIAFGPPEFFGLALLGLTLVTYLSRGSMTKALIAAAVGLLIGCIGLDNVTGAERYTLDIVQLRDGLGLVPVMMGLFGISEVLLNIETANQKREIFNARIRQLLPSREDMRRSTGPIARGTLSGFLIGLIPGPGAIIATFASYAIEKRVSKHPEKFGTGAIEGVAGPETANNAAGGASFIPLLSLGIPCNVAVAVLLSALMIHGVAPGPLLAVERPEIFWGVVGSMYVGNVMLVILNLPLVGLWVKLLKVPYSILFPFILLICLIGSFSLNNSLWDVGITVVFGIVGYAMKKFGYEAAPLVIALVLGPMFEVSLNQSMAMSEIGAGIFFTRPISALLLGTAGVALLLPAILRLLGRGRTIAMIKEAGAD